MDGKPSSEDWRGGDVRAVYYTVLSAVALWGVIALRLAQPILLFKLGANVAGVIFVIASLHLLYLNTRLLPSEAAPTNVAPRRTCCDGVVLRILCRAVSAKRNAVACRALVT